MSPALFCDDGRTIELGDALGEGGEGTVYGVRGARGLAAKVYASPMSAEQHAKLLVMRERPPTTTGSRGPQVRGLAWPRRVLYRDAARRTPIGFVMASYPATRELHMLFKPSERMAFAGWLTWRDLHEIAARVAEIAAAVHAAGHCIGDVNARNVLVSVVERRVVWIDTDSFQIRDASGQVFPCRVGCPDYTPPELEDGEGARTAASDAYSLAVLVYQTLTEGSHPFDGVVLRGDLSRVERMRDGVTPIAGRDDIAFGPDTLPFTALHPALRALFERAFVAGTKNPRARPSAAEWVDALRHAAKSLVRCPVVASHARLRHPWNPWSRSCPWCAAFARTGLDVFRDGSDWQREIARFAKPGAAPRALREQWFDRHAHDRAADGRISRDEESWLLHVAGTLEIGAADAKKRIDAIAAATGAAVDPVDQARRARPPPSVPPVASITQVIAEPPRPPSWTAFAAGIAPILLAAFLDGRGVAGAATTTAAAEPPAWIPPSSGDAIAPPATCTHDASTAHVRTRGGRGARLRRAPSSSAPHTSVPEGTWVTVLGPPIVAGGRTWTPVRTARGALGWIDDAWLSRTMSACSAPSNAAAKPP